MPPEHSLSRRGKRGVKRVPPIAYWVTRLIILSLVLIPFAEARPLFVAHLDSGVVTLTDEACPLQTITNAPKRVTWLEKDGKLTEGCYGRYTARFSFGEVHFIVGYFADLTLQVLPLSLFTNVYPI